MWTSGWCHLKWEQEFLSKNFMNQDEHMAIKMTSEFDEELKEHKSVCVYDNHQFYY